MSEKQFKQVLNSFNQELLEVDGVSDSKRDTVSRLKKYNSADITKFSIEGNSNANEKNYLNRQSEIHKPYDKYLSYYMLWSKLLELYGEKEANESIKECIEGSILVHDLTNGAGIGIDTLYCTTISTKHILYKGRPYYRLHSLQPQNLTGFVGEVVEYILDNANIFAGAVTPSDLIVCMAYFTKKENTSEKAIIQEFQRIVHIINNPWRPSFQSPFVNLSILTREGLMKAFGAFKYPDGSLACDNVDEIIKLQEIFTRFFGKGIKQHNNTYKVASFPVTTINVVRDTYKDDRDYIKTILTNMNKYLNYNLYIGSSFKFSSCCALINDFSKKNAINSFGIGSFGEETIGSARVASLNLYDIALEAKNKNLDFFDVLKEKLDIGYKVLYAQRELCKESLDNGYNIFYNLGWIKLEDYFSSFGAGGAHEAVKVIMGGNLEEDYTEDELNFAGKIPSFIEKYCEERSDEFMKLNLEYLTPLESGARRLGERMDIKYGLNNTMISNRLLPTDIKVSLHRRLEIEDKIGGSASAGGLCHLHVTGEPNVDNIMSILDNIIDNFQNVELISFNKVISYCKDGHETFEDVDTCSYCNEPIVTQISRPVGYFSEVSRFNQSRKEEFKDRAWISEVNVD